MVDPSTRHRTVVHPRSATLRYKSVTARVRPWSRSTTRAFLIISGGHGSQSDVPARHVLDSWLDTLASWGYTSVRTNALGPALSGAFTHLGFSVAQDLTLLEANLTTGATASTTTPPPGNGLDRPAATVHSIGGLRARLSVATRGVTSRSVVGLDEASFPVEWALDRPSLRDALRATPRSTLLCAGPRTSPNGFLLVGIGGATGYIQRLAVHPNARRHGVARDLMNRGLEWSRHMGATRSVVNTESNNVAALALYRSMGFTALDHGLSVLERSLT